MRVQGEEVDKSTKGAEQVFMCECVACVRKGRVKLLSIIVFSNSSVYNIKDIFRIYCFEKLTCLVIW